MNNAVRYALGLLVEEMGECLCHIGRALRFGLDTLGGDEVSERDGLSRELGDVGAAVDFAQRCGIVDRHAVSEQMFRKRDKLLDPKARNNFGGRLAPDPSEAPKAVTR